MNAKRRARQLKTCRDKRERGNIYLSQSQAELRAAQMSLRRKAKIHAYKCPCGEHWHLGRDSNHAERWAREEREERSDDHENEP